MRAEGRGCCSLARGSEARAGSVGSWCDGQTALSQSARAKQVEGWWTQPVPVSSTLTYPSVRVRLPPRQRTGGGVGPVGPRGVHQWCDGPTAAECRGKVWARVCRRRSVFAPGRAVEG